MNSNRRRLAAAGLMAVVLVLAGCSDGDADTNKSDESTPAATTTEPERTPDPEPMQTEPEETPSPAGDGSMIYSHIGSLKEAGFDNEDVSWRGGMVGAVTSNGETATVAGWLPGMSDFAVCKLALWDEADLRPEEGARDETVEVMSTLNSASNGVAVLYTATIPASGLDAEQTRVYLQSLTLDSCTLGPRVDVIGDVDPDLAVPSPKFMGASDSVLAVAPYQSSDTSRLKSPELIGFTPANGAAVWERSFPELDVSISSHSAHNTPVTPAFIEVRTSDLAAIPLEKRTMVSVATGKDVVAAPRFGEPTVELGENRFLYTDGSSGSIVFDNGKKFPITGDVISPRAFPMIREDGTTVAIAKYCAEDDYKCDVDGSGSALGYIGEGNKLVKILSPKQMSSLKLQLYGASNGKLYVETTSENLIIDLNGEQVGESYELEDFPYYPVTERRVQDTTWTLWRTNGSSFAITKDGVNPPYRD